MALGDVQVHQQRGHGFGAHAGAAIGVQCEHAGLDVVTGCLAQLALPVKDALQPED